ncbi:hypothetical protein K438DRAFT_2047591 [Mycena galopus ATCC 62051]|nr:hypothetical protein K438DRAFT_2047591 [Mycena galopus ATCC 62051]
MILPASQVSTKAFDYIVIGGGTSGLTLAAHLSEGHSVSVLVIEAGPANLDDPDILNPALFSGRFGKSQYDWAFQTVPQKNCRHRSLSFNRGKGLGGSSALNFFQYHRPARSDIDAIGELGNPGWNWELLEPYYKKSEDFIQNEMLGADSANHGISGTAMKNLGIDFITDPEVVDCSLLQFSGNKYYQPNATRDNLTVVVGAHVTKIVTEQDQNGCATAVEVAFVCEEASHIVKVSKEVILSAGTIMSPQILELSGIGNKTILEGVGIETRVHLPGVGENVQEHFFARSAYLRHWKNSIRYNSDTTKIMNPAASLWCGHFSGPSQHITSSNPLVPPKIDPNYFEYNYDLLQLVEQIKFCRKIRDQEPMQKLLTGNELLPGPNVQTDEQIAGLFFRTSRESQQFLTCQSDFVKSDLRTTWHGGVVDSRLKVYNTTNIRVVDLSVIPLHIGAHTQATAYALGELGMFKGADIIRGNVF